MLSCLVALAMIVPTQAVESDPTAAAKAAADAARLLRGKKVAAACARLEEAAKLDTANARYRVDLGSCLTRLGRKDEAASSFHRGAALGDRRLRRAAYLGLATLPALRRPLAGSCLDLEAPPGCGSQLKACTHRWTCSDGGRPRIGEGVVVWNARVSQRFGEGQAVRDVDCGDQAAGGRAAPVELTLPESEDDAPADFADLVVEERAAGGKGPPSRTCKVVRANACSGRIGVVCKLGRGNVEVAEYWIATGTKAPPAEN